MSTIHPHKIWKPEELLKMLKDRKLDFMPGSKHKYSNSNYILLGLIAEKVTGKPLKELYREEILDPLGLRNTFFVPYENPPLNLVSGYDRSLILFPGYIEIKSDNTSWSTCAYASGAMASTANDLMRFISSIMDTTIINKKSLELMTSFHQGADKKEKYNKNFGFGLFHFDTIYDNTYGHLGLFIGSEAIVLYHPEKIYIISLISNVSKFNKDELIKDIIRIIEQ
jgi:D-alanyl-D-alanine carboxypeptidase